MDDWRRTVTRTIKRALDCDGAMFTLVPSIEPGSDPTFSEDGLATALQFAAPPSDVLVFDEEQFTGMQGACRSNEGPGVVVVTRDRVRVQPFGEKALARRDARRAHARRGLRSRVARDAGDRTNPGR